MKIALVSAHFQPHIGGVETHVEKLAREHVAAGHEVTVITQTAAGPTLDDFPFPVVRLRSWSPNDAFPVGGGAAKAITSGRFDVVHVHNYHTALFAQAGRFSGLPLVLTPHFHGTSEFALGRAAHVLWSRINSRTWRNVQSVIAVAQQEANLLARQVPSLAGRLAVIPNGVDLPARPATPVPLAATPTILTVGRLERHKRVDRVLRALPFVPHANLVVIGTGPQQAELAALADSLGIASRVRFRGRVSDEQLWAAYQSASTFCTLSEIEAFGLTLAEAMTAGTPVVASDIAAHSEVTRIAPEVASTLIAASASSADVGAALAASLQLPHAPVHSRFKSWAQVAAEVRDVYTQACARPGASAAS